MCLVNPVNCLDSYVVFQAEVGLYWELQTFLLNCDFFLPCTQFLDILKNKVAETCKVWVLCVTVRLRFWKSLLIRSLAQGLASCICLTYFNVIFPECVCVQIYMNKNMHCSEITLISNVHACVCFYREQLVAADWCLTAAASAHSS